MLITHVGQSVCVLVHLEISLTIFLKLRMMFTIDIRKRVRLYLVFNLLPQMRARLVTPIRRPGGGHLI